MREFLPTHPVSQHIILTAQNLSAEIKLTEAVNGIISN